jgi:membrane protease YdiL (CAAX protease family)
MPAGRPAPPLAAPLAVLAVAFAAVPVLQVAAATLDGGFQSSFQRWTYYAVPWALALALAFGSAARGRPLHQALGMGLMSVPLWDVLWGILGSIVPLVQGGFVLRPYTRHQLSGIYSYKLLADLGYLGAGFLLYASPRLGDVLSQRPRALARRLVAEGFPMGLGRGLPEGRSVLAGLALFPVLLLLTVYVNAIVSGVRELNQSDETSLFANMTPYHALLISLAAGFGEELAYRGLLQGWLSRRMPMAAAVVVQAAVFGFAHSGYGTWSHVLLPALFGLAAGVVAWLFGLWAVVTMHVLVDVYAFGVEAARGDFPWVGGVLDVLFLSNLLLSLVVLAYGAAWLLTVVEARRITPR